jgi:hypothetical protein
MEKRRSRSLLSPYEIMRLVPFECETLLGSNKLRVAAGEIEKARILLGDCDQWCRGALAGNLQLAVNSQHYSLGNTERPVPPSVSCFRTAPTEYVGLVFEHASNCSLT